MPLLIMLITISNRCAYKLISYLLTNKKQEKKTQIQHIMESYFPVFLFEYFLNYLSLFSAYF